MQCLPGKLSLNPLILCVSWRMAGKTSFCSGTLICLLSQSQVRSCLFQSLRLRNNRRMQGKWYAICSYIPEQRHYSPDIFSMIIEDAITFLKNVPPFQFLDETVLAEVAKNLSLDFYPKDMVILEQDGPPSDSLRIIKKGGVKISMVSEDGGEVVIDYRGEGASFGV